MCPSDLRSHHSTQTGHNNNKNNNKNNDSNDNDDICNSNNSNKHDHNDDHDDTTAIKSMTETSKHPTSSKSSNEQEPDAASSPSASINFPRLLHEIISDPQTDHLIHWLPGGTHFYISDKKGFASEILSTSRFGHAKFASFIRRLKRWGFVRVPSGPLMGAYFQLGFREGEAVAWELGKCPKGGAGGIGGSVGENVLAALAAGGGGFPRRHGDVMAMAMMNGGNGHPHANLNASFNSTAMAMPLANPQGREMGMMMSPPFDCADAANFASLSSKSFQNRNLNFAHSINGVHSHMINSGIDHGINNGMFNNGMFNDGMFNDGMSNNNHMINHGNQSNQMIINSNLLINGTNNSNHYNYNNNRTFHSDPSPGSMEHSLRQRLLQMSNNRNNNHLGNPTTAITSTNDSLVPSKTGGGSNNHENYSPLSRSAANTSSSLVSMASAGNANHVSYSQSL